MQASPRWLSANTVAIRTHALCAERRVRVMYHHRPIKQHVRACVRHAGIFIWPGAILPCGDFYRFDECASHKLTYIWRASAAHKHTHAHTYLCIYAHFMQTILRGMLARDACTHSCIACRHTCTLQLRNGNIIIIIGIFHEHR